MGRGRHASCATGTLVGAPYGATKRVRGVPRTACELRHWDLRWSSLWGHETCEGCAKMGRVPHAGCATGTLVGAPYGATKRCAGCAETETCGRQRQGGGGGRRGRRRRGEENAGHRLFKTRTQHHRMVGKKGPQYGPGGLQDRPRGPNTSKHKEHLCFTFSPFRSRWASFFPTILWCWVLFLKRQRPAFPPSSRCPPPSCSSSSLPLVSAHPSHFS